MSEQKKFSPGRNIAMKVPPHAHEDTVRFYRDVLGFEELAEFRPAVVFKFGDKNLWIDRVPGLSQAEIWLEVQTNDLAAAEQQLAGGSIVRCDEIEPLPDGFRGFWISSPAAIVHLVREQR